MSKSTKDDSPHQPATAISLLENEPQESEFQTRLFDTLENIFTSPLVMVMLLLCFITGVYALIKVVQNRDMLIFDPETLTTQSEPIVFKRFLAEVPGFNHPLYFNPLTNEIGYCEVEEDEDFLLLQLYLNELHPSLVLIASNTTDALVSYLASYAESSSASIHKCSPSIYTEATAQRFIPLLRCPHLCLPSHATNTLSRASTLSVLFDFTKIQATRAIGSLLSYLHHTPTAGAELNPADGTLVVEDLRELGLTNLLTMDALSLRALHIFHTQKHPSMTGIGVTKEGLSLVSLFTQTVSVGGTRLMNQWFHRPLSNRRLIVQRHDTIDFFRVHFATDQIREMQALLAKIKPCGPILLSLRKGISTQTLFTTFLKTLLNTYTVLEALKQSTKASQLPLFQRIQQFDHLILLNLSRMIFNTLIFDDSNKNADVSDHPEDDDGNEVNECPPEDEGNQTKRMKTKQLSGESDVAVRPGINPQLDALRETYSSLHLIMSNAAADVLDNIDSDLVDSLSVSFFPNLGFLISIKQDHIISPDTFESESGFQFQFGIEEDRFYKNEQMRQMDLEMGNLPEQIGDIERKIVSGLCDEIDTHALALIDSSDLISELDCFLSFVTSSYEFNLVRPVMVDEPCIHITKGRNLIQELLLPQFIPNSTSLRGDKPAAISIITGPNASGKSVYLRQVGQIVFLSHVGCFVPAVSATIGIIDRLFTRILTPESISTPLSTFMLESLQVSSMMRSSTRKSLLLLDEYGKGTNHHDGLALLTAVLSHFLRKGQDTPTIILTTHFHELSHEQSLPVSPLISFSTMQFLLARQHTTASSLEDIRFTYRLISGSAPSSFSLFCAKLAGVPDSIIQRAQKVIQTNLQPEDSTNQIRPSGRCEKAVELFRAFNVDTGDIMSFIQQLIKEKAFTLYQGVYYDSVIQEERRRGESREYYVSYPRFTKRYDEWVTEDRMLKKTPENTLLTKRIYKEAQRAEKEKIKRKETHVSSTPSKLEEPASDSDNPFVEDFLFLEKLTIDHMLCAALKTHLIGDFAATTEGNMLIPLPRSPNITRILRGFHFFIHEKYSIDVSKFINSITEYFNLTISPLLLTQKEIVQFDYWRILLRAARKQLPGRPLKFINAAGEEISMPTQLPEDSQTFCDIYGGEHLLRLIVNLPLLIASAPDLQGNLWRRCCEKHLDLLSKYLSSFSEHIFQSDYTSCDKLDSRYNAFIHQLRPEDKAYP
ncbi:putative DNA mismatch repair protein MSH5 [Blattamonas nauphoetae]|uniref:DNA mismatch repair protein MSH5 n=1 Tax=Blattamonas nauphoetae TaxID=2049346 RepID=A0ABQ9YM59_9EUKA|nr:putative DNA mismatch repair protein MSH5 [Blattamonas nauphoetae]